MKTLSKKSVLSSLVSIFVLLITLLIFSSGCRPPETTENTIINPANPIGNQIVYNVHFVTPTFGDIYSTDMDESGDTIDPEPVNIDVEISGNRIFESLSIQVRNNASNLIYSKHYSYSNIENKLTFHIEETFLTNVADIYKIYVVSTYEGTGSIYSEPMVFEYQIPVPDGN